MGKILLRKLRLRGKVYVARSYRKSRGVLGAHFVSYARGTKKKLFLYKFITVICEYKKFRERVSYC